MTNASHPFSSFLFVAAFAIASIGTAHAAVPAFAVQDIGLGVPVDVNANGSVVGQDTYTASQPWVLRAGVKSLLPLPAGVTSATVSRINDADVVVGQVANQPAIWRPTVGGYQLQLIAFPPGATIGRAIDANLAGQVVVTFGTPGVTYTGLQYVSYKPYLYDSAAGTLLDLTTFYTVSETSFPDVVDITDGGRMLTSSGEILEPNYTVTAAPPWPPRPPGGYSWVAFGATRMNETGEFIGRAVLSSSMVYAQVVKYTPGTGWQVLGGLSSNVGGIGISEPGDALIFANYVCPINYGLGFAVDGGSTYCLDDLLLEPGWSFTSFSSKGAIAGTGIIAALGYSTSVAAYRLALLRPAGSLPPPSAVSLTAAPHPGTSSQPWDAITLTWTSAGYLAKQYAIERVDPGMTSFVEIARIGATVTEYNDQAITPRATYSYRVRAIGLAGPGPYSNQATARAPAAMDRTAPGVTILSPLNGATVTGSVTVSATFTDNVGVTFTRFEYQPNMGNGIICDRYPAAGTTSITVSCKWDTTKVAYQSPAATLTAYASDAIGNWTQQSFTVNVTYAPKKGRR
jgi:hypothetical protein